jgi:hypothetical protein
VYRTWLCLLQTKVVGVVMCLYREVLHFTVVVTGLRASLEAATRWQAYLLKCTMFISQCIKFTQEARRMFMDHTANAKPRLRGCTSTLTDHKLVFDTDTALAAIINWLVEAGLDDAAQMDVWVETVYLAAARLRAVSAVHPSEALATALFALNSQRVWRAALSKMDPPVCAEVPGASCASETTSVSSQSSTTTTTTATATSMFASMDMSVSMSELGGGTVDTARGSAVGMVPAPVPGPVPAPLEALESEPESESESELEPEFDPDCARGRKRVCLRMTPPGPMPVYVAPRR